MVTFAGTESSELLLAIDTTESVVVAAFKLTEHLADTWLDIAVGEQDSDLGCPFVALLAVSVNVWEPPLRVAVSKAFWLEVTAAMVAVNVALLSPVEIFTLPGTVTLVLLLDSVTLAALEAAALKVAVQVEVPGPVTEPGEQVKPLNCAATAAVRLRIACWLWPLRVAVTVALWLLLTLLEAAVKVALLWPDATVMLAGTVSNPLLLASETVAALVAVVLNVTVHVLDALLPRVEGAQASDVSCAGAGAVALIVKDWETPFNVAVSRADWLAVTAATVAVNVALLSPAVILTLPGTVTLVLVLDSVTLEVLDAAAVRVTVQVEVPGAFTVAGEQVRLLSWTAADRLMVACWLWPPRLAVTVAFWLMLTVPEVAAKVALLWPSATVTLAGTVSNALASDTVAALVAALFNVTVQVLDALLPRLDGAQASEESWAGATRFNVLVRFTLPALAVTTPVWLLLTCAPVAVKLLEVCPAATITLEGTVRLALLLDRDTVNPPTGADPVKPTEQGVLPGVLMLALVQLRVLNARVTGREIAPEPPLAGIEDPVALVATTVVSWIAIGLLEGFAAIWKVAVATVPSAITVLLMPATRQLFPFPEQERDFPASVVDFPATTVTPVMSEE
jgi:hypothetical protein